MIEWKQNIDCKLASLSDTLEKCTGVNEAIVSRQNTFYFKFVIFCIASETNDGMHLPDMTTCMMMY